MNRLGLSEFTTMSVEASNNGTVTAGSWQDWTLTDTTMVWQTNATGGFCLIASPCQFSAFKAQYPAAVMIGVQAAIGTGVPATSSYVDSISLTISGTTDTWDFELPAADASDAVIGSATVTATGADVVIDLTASDLSVEPRVFTIEVEGQPPQTVTLDPGETDLDHGQRPIRDDGHQRAHPGRRRRDRDRRCGGAWSAGRRRDAAAHRYRYAGGRSKYD